MEGRGVRGNVTVARFFRAAPRDLGRVRILSGDRLSARCAQHTPPPSDTPSLVASFRPREERNTVAAAALEQSILESKDKDTLLEMAKALGVKVNARLKKARHHRQDPRHHRIEQHTRPGRSCRDSTGRRPRDERRRFTGWPPRSCSGLTANRSPIGRSTSPATAPLSTAATRRRPVMRNRAPTETAPISLAAIETATSRRRGRSAGREPQRTGSQPQQRSGRYPQRSGRQPQRQGGNRNDGTGRNRNDQAGTRTTRAATATIRAPTATGTTATQAMATSVVGAVARVEAARKARRAKTSS